MSWFHVFVRQEGDAALRLLASDLAEEDVRRQIVKPYRRGTSLVHGGTIIPVASLRGMTICKTELTFQEAYSAAHAEHSKQMEEINRGGGVYFISAGPGHDDMAEVFPIVTDHFLRGKEPGDAARPSVLLAITNHPVVSTVVGGVVLAGAVYFLGWK